MFKQNYQKVVIVAILLTVVSSIGMYQQVLASPPCGYNDGCYTYPQQNGWSSQVVLNQNVSPESVAPFVGL